MNNFQSFDPAPLDQAGLNRQAVFNIAALPADVLASLRAGNPVLDSCRQLILIGHAGKRLWESVRAAGIASEHPVDEFTMKTVRAWFAACQPQNSCHMIYPGPQPIGLQSLGQLAGWHHATPFKVGIDHAWGSWFAYRAVVLSDTDFAPTLPLVSSSPCSQCAHQTCIGNCPANALESGQLDLGKCIGYRKQAGSVCKATCPARVSCPVGSEHRYEDEQMRHIYSNSMRYIERYC